MNPAQTTRVTAPAAAAHGGLRTVLRTTAPIAPATSVIDVAQRILDPQHEGLLSLPVVDEGRPVGTISRYELMRVFLMPYGRELYGRRPITSLMNASPLVLDWATPLDLAARAIATHIRSPITDDFVLVDGAGAYVGTGVVLDVLRAVEARLAERGGELERAYARLKSSQLQLVQSEKMASLGQMVAGLVHEINTPLGYVRNNVEMTRDALGDTVRLVASQQAVVDALLGGGEVGESGFEVHLAEIEMLRARVDTAALEDLRELLDDTLHGVGQIGDLVLNLKDFSRLDQAGFQKADVNKLVDGALKIAQHLLRKSGVAVVREAGDVPEIECAPAQINQVLLNLVGNAIQAIDHDRGRILVRTQWLDGRALILVEDNGKGIAAENLQRIFDPFFTTKPVGQGTGLGLAISHQIVGQHGGTIRVASKPGVGTRFLVVLPAAPAEKSA
ncbi:ATP-binding protein [Dokdonella sp.]|uniref:sensor histidine kinase n=1 Tax=Dokdonella sp. TaxID=2291710 RepID=UPI0026393758|nr:ATP-binding protein [Dokdonella sp.]